MSFATPLFLAALGLLLPIVLAFLVKRQRKELLRVPSTMVWRLGALSVAKTKRIRDLRRLLALLACLGGVAALVVAAARPIGKGDDVVVYVVDVSASMEGAPLDSARHWLSREVVGMGPNARIAIVLAGAEARSILAPSPPGPLVDRAIASIAVQRQGAALEEAVALAEGLVPNGSRIVVLTDAPLDAQISTRDTKPVVRVFAHTGSDNLGIASLFTRTPADARDEAEREATVVVATSSANKRRAKVTLTLAGRSVAERHIEIPEHGETIERIAIHGSGRLVARVVSDDGKSDALTIDDQASLDEVSRKAPRVALLRAGDSTAGFFVERALRAAGVTELVDVDPDGLTSAGVADVAVVLEDGPARPQNLPTFFIGVNPRDLHLAVKTIDGKKGGTHVRSIATEDPIVRGVALDEMTTHRAYVLAQLPPRTRSLVDLDSGPTLVAGQGAHPWIWLGIDPEASDLVLRVAFPVLVGNVLAELSGASQVVNASAVPRAEIAFASSDVTAPLAAPPEPRWRVPASASMLLAGLGAFLLALEAWLSFRKRWAL